MTDSSILVFNLHKIKIFRPPHFPDAVGMTDINSQPNHDCLYNKRQFIGIFSSFLSDKFVNAVDEDFSKSSNIIFGAGLDSIDTRNQQLDMHPKSADFFNVVEYRQIKFVGTLFHEQSEETKLKGNLTIKGIAYQIKEEFGVVDPLEQTRDRIKGE